MHASRLSSGDISSEVLRVLLGVYLPLRALVIHRVLQAVPVFARRRARHVFESQGHPFSCKYLRAGKCPFRLRKQHMLRSLQSRLFSRAHFSSLTLPGQQRRCIRLPQLHQEVQRLSRRVETELRRCPSGRMIRVRRVHMHPRPYVEECSYHAPGTRRSRTLRVRSGRLGGVPPQLAHHREVDAGLDALHVGEDHGRDIQVRIEGGTVRIELTFVVLGRHVEAVRGRK